MASEYFLKKAKEEYKPREVHIITAAERRKSRWYYHKRQIIIGAFFGICIIIILWNVLGIGKFTGAESLQWWREERTKMDYNPFTPLSFHAIGKSAGRWSADFLYNAKTDFANSAKSVFYQQASISFIFIS